LWSYLDNLSAFNNDEKDEPEDPTRTPKDGDGIIGEPRRKKWIAPSGGGGTIPSGRGPQASYLSVMTGETKEYEDDNLAAENDDDDDDAYSPSMMKGPTSSKSYLTNFWTRDNNENDDSRTDIRNLLTQRSIQTFMHLLEQCRVRIPACHATKSIL